MPKRARLGWELIFQVVSTNVSQPSTSLANNCTLDQYLAMGGDGEGKRVHMVKVSACGTAHAAHQFIASWASVTCPVCIAKRAHRCLHCGRDCNTTVRWTRAGFVHVECWPPFQLSARFTAMLKTDPQLLTGERCSHCGGYCPSGKCWMKER